jgi:predicted RNase H-like nuclease (RuvC/YqgF family)
LVKSLIFAWRNQLGTILDTNGDSLRSQVENAIAAAYPNNEPVNKLSLTVEPNNKLKTESERIRLLQQENSLMRSQLETAEHLIGRRLLEMSHRHEQQKKKQECAIEQLASENSSLYRQMNDLVLKAEEWASAPRRLKRSWMCLLPKLSTCVLQLQEQIVNVHLPDE